MGQIDEARERWNVLRHPFYTRWERGELTRDELAFYAGEYRHAVAALAEAASAAGDAEHAREEADHVALWDALSRSDTSPLVVMTTCRFPLTRVVEVRLKRMVPASAMARCIP